jgi:hypothetical protein
MDVPFGSIDHHGFWYFGVLRGLVPKKRSQLRLEVTINGRFFSN